MKKLIIINIIIIYLFSAGVRAGGFFVSDNSMDIYQPDQKAIIQWDGRKQVMLLATGLRSNDIANFAWIIPVISEEEPVISEADMQSHEYLAGLFRGRKKAPVRGPGLFGKKIVRSKKLEVYDTFIIKADEAQDLPDRLKEEGYIFPEGDVEALGKYLMDRKVYFVINKLNLRDMFSKEVAEVEEIYDNVKNEYNSLLREIRELFSNEFFRDRRHGGKKIEKVIIDYLKTWSPRKTRDKPGFYWLEDYYNKIIKKEFKKHKLTSRVVFLLNDETLRVEGNPVFNMSISEEGLKLNVTYDFNIMKYYWKKGSFSIDGYSLQNNRIYIKKEKAEEYKEMLARYGRIRSLKEEDMDVLNRFFSLEDFDYSDLVRQLDERVSIVNNNVMGGAENMAKEYLPRLIKLFKRIEEYNKKPQIYRKKFYNEKYDARFSEKVKSVVKASSISHDVKGMYDELIIVVDKLEEGINTPLRIEFEPDTPVYPIGLSFINSGVSRVEVFFAGRGQVNDPKEILLKDKKTINIEKDLDVGLLPEFDMAGMKKISWFGQVYSLKEFRKDVLFKVD